jgi:hypothetical protein
MEFLFGRSSDPEGEEPDIPEPRLQAPDGEAMGPALPGPEGDVFETCSSGLRYLR